MRRAITHLSAYQHMWILVMFDLPTSTKTERQEYTKFRHFLLEQSFTMAQYSVYIRHVNSRAQTKPIIRKIEQAMPPAGKVDIMQITDRQYADTVSLFGRKRCSEKKPSPQLALF